MHEINPEKKAIRTVRRKRIQDLLAVLFFLLLLPYTCSSLARTGEENAVETADIGRSKTGILWERENGVWRIGTDEFLTGALAACIPAEYHEETLKAQAVILRSICMQEAMEKGTLSKEDSQLEFLEREERKTLWGENFAENEAKFLKAVRDTEGIVLNWEGNLVSPPYFRLSAGQTRSGAEIFGEEQKPWYHSVECPHDLEADDFLQEKRLDRGEFSKKLAAEGMILPGKGAKVVLTRDSAGYVLTVSCESAQMEGEKFRKLFELPSSCFYLKEENGEIILQTKGIGHGIGFDQYGADLLAAGGKDYIELLNFFFTGLTMEKME